MTAEPRVDGAVRDVGQWKTRLFADRGGSDWQCARQDAPAQLAGDSRETDSYEPHRVPSANAPAAVHSNMSYPAGMIEP